VNLPSHKVALDPDEPLPPVDAPPLHRAEFAKPHARSERAQQERVHFPEVLLGGRNEELCLFARVGVDRCALRRVRVPQLAPQSPRPERRVCRQMPILDGLGQNRTERADDAGDGLRLQA
jgi:hypothetical protein